MTGQVGVDAPPYNDIFRRRRVGDTIDVVDASSRMTSKIGVPPSETRWKRKGNYQTLIDRFPVEEISNGPGEGFEGFLFMPE
jgi:hypothetical protein